MDFSEPKVNLRSLIFVGKASLGSSPVDALAMKYDLYAGSSIPWAIALAPSTSARACTPVKPPNQAR